VSSLIIKGKLLLLLLSVLKTCTLQPALCVVIPAGVVKQRSIGMPGEVGNVCISSICVSTAACTILTIHAICERAGKRLTPTSLAHYTTGRGSLCSEQAYNVSNSFAL